MLARKILILVLPLLLVIAVKASPIMDGEKTPGNENSENKIATPESQVAQPETNDKKNQPSPSEGKNNNKNAPNSPGEKNDTKVNFIYASSAEKPSKNKHDKKHPSTVDIVVKIPPEAEIAAVRPTLFINPILKTTTVAPNNVTTQGRTTAAPENTSTCASGPENRPGTYYERPNELRGYECLTRNGYFRYRKTCDVYIKCEDYIPRTYICDEGFQFNPNAVNSTQVCYDASVVKCEAGAAKPGTPKTDLDALRCPTGFGFFKTERCDEYVECKVYKPYRYKCPEGMGFNSRAVWPHYPCAPSAMLQCENA